jgi:hypothetical protein
LPEDVGLIKGPVLRTNARLPRVFSSMDTKQSASSQQLASNVDLALRWQASQASKGKEWAKKVDRTSSLPQRASGYLHLPSPLYLCPCFETGCPISEWKSTRESGFMAFGLRHIVEGGGSDLRAFKGDIVRVLLLVI